MYDAAAELAGYRVSLQAREIDPEPLAAQARPFPDLPEADPDKALAAFHAAADRVPTPFDTDYGSAVLEAVAEACPDPVRQQRLYVEALNRAAYFASAATSGGEGTARMVDVLRLRERVRRFGLSAP